MRDDVVELDGVESEVLAARADSLGDVLRLRSRHHEDDVLRRLLQSFQQGIKSRIGDLVGLVEQVDLVAIACRGVPGGVAQFTDFVDPAVGGGVNLHYVERVAGAYLLAGVANSAGLGGGSLALPILLRQFNAMARILAMVVLPMPRCP